MFASSLISRHIGSATVPLQDEILRAMNRIMQPDAVAVIGASPEDGKIGNSVMKNLINGGYQGAIYPIHPKVPEVLGRKAYKSVKDISGPIDVAVFAIPAPLVAGALKEVWRREKIPGAVLIPRAFAETGNVEGQEQIVAIAREYNVRLMGSQHPYGFYYTHKNPYALLFVRPTTSKGKGRVVVAERRRRDGDYWIQPLCQDGGFRDCRVGQ